MPLSEYEQRVLDELERDLGTDPKLASAMTRAPRSAGQLIIGGIGVVGGLGVVLAGVMTKIWILGIGGFALMAGVVLWALLGSGSRPAPRASSASSRQARRKASRGFMGRLEDRFEKRRESGEL